MFTNKLISTICITFLSISIFSQAPEAFSFQGVAYDENSDPITEQDIDVRIEILTDPSSTVSIYSEEHNVLTSPSGLFSLEVGRGNTISGVFSDIDWGSSSHFLKVGIDVNDNGDFAIMGITELLSVPYALYAENTTIKPNFFISYGALRGPATLKKIKDEIGSLIAQTFEFHWIDGIPEDVYVDYIGIPEGLCLQQFLLNGARRLIENKILSEVDTIYSGLLNPWTKLVLCEEGVYPEPGNYRIDQYFRTGNTIHDSLHFFLEIFENDQTACFPDGPLTYNYVETDCDSIPSNLATTLTLDLIGEDEISIPAPIDTLVAEIGSYYFPSCYTSLNANWNYLAYDSDSFINADIDVDLRNPTFETLTFSFASSWYDENSIYFSNSCRVTYEREE